jgi:hypothetical protein
LRDIAEDLGEPLSDIELQYLTKEFDSDQRCGFKNLYLYCLCLSLLRVRAGYCGALAAEALAGWSSSRGGSCHSNTSPFVPNGYKKCVCSHFPLSNRFRLIYSLRDCCVSVAFPHPIIVADAIPPDVTSPALRIKKPISK